MTPHQTRVVEEARKWIGTPYCHQASCLGAGTDCLGLIRGVWRGLFGVEPEQVPAYTQDWAEPDRSEALWTAALRHLRAVERAAPGDVLLFRMREGASAKHLGIAAGTSLAPSFIHAYSGHAVVESHLGAAWQRRIVARFRFPLEDT